MNAYFAYSQALPDVSLLHYLRNRRPIFTMAGDGTIGQISRTNW
jgi:hypothetical protein